MDSLSDMLPADFDCLGSATEFADDIHEIFSNFGLVEGPDTSETLLLCNFMVCYSAPRGAKLVQQGEVGNYMFFCSPAMRSCSSRTTEVSRCPLAP